jgi:hypothetical protein
MDDDQPHAPKHFHLMGADGELFESAIPGTLAGNRKLKTYGLLNCGLPSCGFPDRGMPSNQPKIRVFFADEDSAIAAGYRPCGGCLPQRYRQWKRGPQSGEPYPWKTMTTVQPKSRKKST